MSTARTVKTVLAAQAVTAVVAGALLHAAHWRRRAHAASATELESAVAQQLAILATADVSQAGLASSIVIEAEQPPIADRRWFWWAGATCPACHGVHEPGQGWEPTERHAREAADEHLAYATSLGYMTDPDNDYACTDLDDDEEGDEDEDAAPSA